MRVTEAIKEAARLGRELAEIDERLRNEQFEDAERRKLEAERREVIRALALKDAIEE